MERGVIIIEGHVQGLSNLRSIGEAGIPAWVLDQHNCIARYSKYCSKYIKCSPYESKEFISELKELGVKYNLKNCLLIPSNDKAVHNLSKHSEQLKPHFVLFSSEFDVIDNIINKKKLLQIARSENISIPPTHYFSSADESIPSEITYPFIIKGCIGQDFYKNIGKKVIVIKNEKELHKSLIHIDHSIGLDNSIAQSIINRKKRNPTISFCSIAQNGQILSYWMGEKLNEHPVRFGTATLTRSSFVEDLIEPSKILIEKLNYTGISEIEWLLNDETGEYNLIEINPRTWLWIELAKACGKDFVKTMYEKVYDKELSYPKSEQYETNIYWYNPITYYPFKIIALFSGVSVKSPKGKKVNALFIKGDSKPGWMYFINLFNIFRRR